VVKKKGKRGEEGVDPKYSRIDQIFALRTKNDREKPFNTRVVINLFKFVKQHLTAPWSDIENRLRKEGKVLP
jgi:hypothetical protein